MITRANHELERAKDAQAINLLIIGGSDAGIGAALRARQINPTVQVTVVADRYPN